VNKKSPRYSVTALQSLPSWLGIAWDDSTIQAIEDKSPSPDPTPSLSGSLPWRRALAVWPEEWRERWGRLAGTLEAADGLSWEEAERKAFAEVNKAKRDSLSPSPAPERSVTR